MVRTPSSGVAAEENGGGLGEDRGKDGERVQNGRKEGGRSGGENREREKESERKNERE